MCASPIIYHHCFTFVVVVVRIFSFLLPVVSSKAQARTAFSSYLQRVQQRLLAESRANAIPAWPDKDNEQMVLLFYFLSLWVSGVDYQKHCFLCMYLYARSCSIISLLLICSLAVVELYTKGICGHIEGKVASEKLESLTGALEWHVSSLSSSSSVTSNILGKPV